jgi:hypothetical protein
MMRESTIQYIVEKNSYAVTKTLLQVAVTTFPNKEKEPHRRRAPQRPENRGMVLAHVHGGGSTRLLALAPGV